MMMHRKIFALALAAVLILSGCQPGVDESGQSAPTGRYLEEEVFLPQGADYILVLDRDATGGLILLGESQAGEISLWLSDDSGDTWDKQEHAWLGELPAMNVLRAAVNPAGELYVTFLEERGEELVHRVAVCSGDGIQVLPVVVPPDEDGEPWIWDITARDDGSLFVNYQSRGLLLDSRTGEALREWDYQAEGLALATGGYGFLGKQMVYTTGRDIFLEDASGGVTEVSTSDNRAYSSRIITADSVDQSVYYCDSSGIYRTMMGSPVTEQLVSGDGTTLNMPTYWPDSLLVLPGGDFLVSGHAQGERHFYRYRYHADIPSAPTRELRVYSLYNRYTVRQAIGVFQRENPDVQVTYTVGCPDDQSIYADDAIRVLSTELLAGQGPDVLVLDFLPMESYIEKGVLLDLSDAFSSQIESGALLPNVAASYRRDGTLYAIPCKFSVPAVLAATDRALDSLTDITDYLEGDADALTFCNIPAYLMEEYLGIEQMGLFQQDGMLDEAAFVDFLRNIQRLSALDAAVREDYPGRSEMWEGAPGFAGKAYSQYTAPLYSVADAVYAQAAIRERGEGQLFLLHADEGGIFFPQVVMGVNANGQQQDIALRFLETALSEPAMAGANDGFPISAAALERSLQNPYPQLDEYMRLEYQIGVATYELSVQWPDDTFCQSLYRELMALSTPVHVDLTKSFLLYGLCENFLNGTKSLENTVAEAKGKIDLVISENG